VESLDDENVAPLEEDFEPESETLVALLGGSVRKGAWEPRERIRVFALMGGAELDFREAVMLEGITEVWVFALMGGVNILAPPDLNVHVRGTGLMGGFTELSHRADDPDAPVLRVRGVAVMGGVDVKIRAEKRSWFGSK
jgi:hypothetical protein